MDERGVSRRGVLASLGTLGVAGAAGCLGAPVGGNDQDTPALTPDPTPTPRDIDRPPADLDARYAEVYEATVDAVAMVTAVGPTGPIGQGSGFIHSPGHVLTNEHVVRTATEVDLEFPSGEWVTGEIVGADEHSDLAIVGFDGGPTETAPLAPSPYRPTVGQEVMAIGNPFGLEESVSQGIVSGVGRNLPTGDDFNIPDTVQTDAGVNPGNSGGPLVTMDGDYLGVITARQGQEIGYAVSWRLAERVVPALIETGSYDHPFIGIRTVSITPTVARENDLEEATGVMVVESVPDGPAGDAFDGASDSTIVGDQEIPIGGDIIVGFDGHDIPDSEALSTFLALHTSPGDELAVTVRRDGVSVTEHIELGVRPSP